MKKQLYLTVILAIFCFPFISQAQTNYEDVVYLKNGSVIHGTIIEQIPNQSIKIKTRDRNVFVYKIDEIEKMTKEPTIDASFDNKPSRYAVLVTLKSGEKLKGKLIRNTPDSVSIMNSRNFQRIRVSEIMSIRIRGKRALALGFGLGAASGAVIGAIIGYASWSPRNGCSNSWWGSCIDLGPEADAVTGAVIGAAAGTLLGGAIGSAAGTEFKIEGSQTQFDLFAIEYNNKVSSEKSK